MTPAPGSILLPVNSGRYVVAPHRERRGAVGTDWLDGLRSVKGVTVLGGSARRALIETDPRTVEGLRRRLGADFIIEPVIEHRRVATDLAV